MASAINIVLGAQVTPFVQGMTQARAAIGSLGGSFSQLRGSIDQPRGAFASLTRQLNITKAEMQDILAVGGRIPAELQQRYRLLQGSVNSVNQAFASRDAKGFSLGLSGMAIAATAATAAIGGIKKALDITSEVQRLNVSLEAVSSGAADFARTQQFLTAASDGLGLSYATLAGSYKGLKAATNGTALEGQQTEKIFLSVVRASAALQLSSEQTEGALLALQQMMSKGKVQAEELRGQLGERIPGAFRLFAQALGVSEKQLNKMLEQGEVLAADVLPKFAQKLEEAYGSKAQNNVNTLTGSMTRATDQAKLFFAEFTQASGVDATFTNINNNIANTLRGMREAIRSKEWGTFFAAISPNASVRDLADFRLEQLNRNRTVIDEFSQASAAQRQARIGVLADEIKLLEKQLADRDNTLIGGRKSRITADLENQKRLLADLLKINAGKSFQDLFSFVGGLGKSPDADKTAYNLEAARKQQKALAERIQQITFSQGAGAVPTTLRREYDQLTAKIEAAEKSTQKLKATTATLTESTLTTNERILNRLTTQLKKYGDTADGSLSRQVVIFQNLVKQEKELAKNPLGRMTLEVKSIRFTGKNNLLDQVQDIVGRQGRASEGLQIRAGEITQFGSLAYYQEQLGKIDSQLQKLAVKGNRIPPIDDSVIASIVEYNEKLSLANTTLLKSQRLAENERLSKLPQIGGISFGGFDLKLFNDSANTLEERTLSLRNSIVGSIQEAASATVGAFGEWVGAMIAGTAQLADLPKALGGVFASLAKSMGQALISFGTASLAAQALIPNPIGAIAAGVALVALGSALQATLQKQTQGAFGGNRRVALARGGLAYGQTQAIIGDNYAARFNPEVVSPLSDLQKLIPMAAAPQAISVSGELVARGSDLVLVYDRAIQYRNGFKGR
ncbi:hypothetical protein DYU11_19975 [Fibrisoma montanum]|uniref:Tape measure protein N-terminal domain-containing protein n=1 Tax=Fibrisoma montanum TaxID=2305895 RepID=A0A418M3I6_9BACT|nr:tape measure protein [Fibrisoma montanum]RIV20332.1 hypothetical protein DYU11_19975 [Fibrisoma montanum]